MSISVVYWSGTGNTQAMAEAIGEGIESAGAQANVISVDQASVDALAEEDVFALGCSAMGAEELEESEMEPFVAELEGKVSGKKILLFGSYGWGVRMDEKLGRTYDGSRSQDGRTRRRNRK